MKILLVEDDQSICTLLKQALAVHYTVEIARDGRSALALAEQVNYDVLLLDVGIPELDGISVCKQLRAQGYQTPILLITAKDGVDDRVLGLDAGADDYMVKPVHVPELMARIRALMRRGKTSAASSVTWGDLQLDCVTREIHYGEQLLRLTPKEYGILELLLLNPQRIFSRSAMIERLWELDEPPTESAISSHIKAIRQKLKAAGATQDWIETMYGFGYRLRSLDYMAAGATASMSEPDAAPTSPSDVDNSKRSGDSRAFPETLEMSTAQLWQKYEKSFGNQLELLDRAVAALQTHSLTHDLRQEAEQTAHKMIGSLGVHGLLHGAALARHIEHQLLPGRSLLSPEIRQLADWVADLKHEVAQKSISSMVSIPQSPYPLVLVVNDDQALTAQLQADAQQQSLQIVIAPDLMTAQSILDRTLPHVIVLDLTVSDPEDNLDWLEVLKQHYPQIPVLVFTKQDSLSDRLTVSRLGARHLLQKPVSTDQIFQAIDRMLPKPLSKAKVLIVDDDLEVLALLSVMLTPWGVEVLTLSEPQRFWEVLVAASPSLVLLDLEMPQVNGLELCQIVRQDLQWGNLPILVVTAHTDAGSLQRAFAAGADDFIIKPVLGPELVTRVLSRIERTQYRQPL